MLMFAARVMVWVMCACLTVFAGAAGIEDPGSYRVLDRPIGSEPLPIEDNVRLVPPPTGGPLRVSIKTDKPRYHVTDPIRISFGVNRDSYVYIFSTDAAGLNRQLFPNYHDTNNFMRAGRTYYVPSKAYDMEVRGPQGREHLTIVATTEDFPFLNEYRYYSVSDPYPGSRDGATGLVREIESFRREPSSTTIQPIRPAIRENLWASNDTTFYVMGNEKLEPMVYKTPRFGNLDVDTYPSNARIFIGTEYRGRSPQVIDRLTIGYHLMRIEKEGYIPYECHVYIKGNETKQVDVFMQTTPVSPAPGYHDGQMRGGSSIDLPHLRNEH